VHRHGPDSPCPGSNTLPLSVTAQRDKPGFASHQPAPIDNTAAVSSVPSTQSSVPDRLWSPPDFALIKHIPKLARPVCASHLASLLWSIVQESELQKPGINHVITKDDNDVLQCVAFCTEHQQQLAAKYGGVVLLDGTYRINKFRMPLYTLAVVDSEGHGQPIAHALVAREDVAHITMFLDSAREWFPSVECAIFIVDKDYAEINAINAVFPDASIHLCRFHVLKAFLEEMKRQSLQRDHTLYKVL